MADNNQPIPERHDHWALRFKKLNVGESVFVENEYGRVAAYKYGKTHGTAYRTRKQDGGFRVWRIA